MLSIFFSFVFSGKLRLEKLIDTELMFNIYYDNEIFFNDTKFQIQFQNEGYSRNTIKFNNENTGFIKGLEVKYKVFPTLEDKLNLEFTILNNYTNSITFQPHVTFDENQAYLQHFDNAYDAEITPIGSDNGFLAENVAVLSYDNDFSRRGTVHTKILYRQGARLTYYAEQQISFTREMLTLQPFDEFTFRLVITTKDYIEPAPLIRLDPNISRNDVGYNTPVKLTGNITGYKVGQNITIYQIDFGLFVTFYSITITEANKPIPISLSTKANHDWYISASSDVGLRSIDASKDFDAAEFYADCHFEITKPPERDVGFGSRIKLEFSATGLGMYYACIKFGNLLMHSNEYFTLDENPKTLSVYVPTFYDNYWNYVEVTEGVYNASIFLLGYRSRKQSNIIPFEFNVTTLIVEPKIYVKKSDYDYSNEIRMEQPTREIEFIVLTFRAGVRYTFYATLVDREGANESLIEESFVSNGNSRIISLNFTVKNNMQSYQGSIFYSVNSTDFDSSPLYRADIGYNFYSIINIPVEPNSILQGLFAPFDEDLIVPINLIYSQNCEFTLKYRVREYGGPEDGNYTELPEIYRTNPETNMTTININLGIITRSVDYEIVATPNQSISERTHKYVSIYASNTNIELLSIDGFKDQYDIDGVANVNISFNSTTPIAFMVVEIEELGIAQVVGNINGEGYGGYGGYEDENIDLTYEVYNTSSTFQLVGEGFRLYTNSYNYARDLNVIQILQNKEFTYKFYLLDRNYAKSNTVIRKIFFGRNLSPEVSLDDFYVPANFYGPFECRFNIYDFNTQDHVSLYYYFDDDPPTKIFAFKSNGERKYYKITINETFSEGEHTLNHYAIDDPGGKTTDTKIFRCYRSPEIKRHDYFNSLLETGSQVHLNATVAGFKPGNQLTLHITIDGVDKNYTDPSLIIPYYDFDVLITVDIPDHHASFYGIEFYFTDGESVVKNKMTRWFDIRYTITITGIKPLEKSIYSFGDSIILETLIFSQYSSVEFLYNFDEEKFDTDRKQTYYINSNQDNPLKHTIPITNIYASGQHRLWFRYQNYPVTSYVDFTITDNHRPDMILTKLTSGDLFPYYQKKIDFEISARDYDMGDIDRVFVQVNSEEPIVIHRFTANRKYQTVNYSFIIPWEDKQYTLYFWIQDSHDAVSSKESRSFTIKKMREVKLITPLKDQYVPHSFIHAQVYVVDFEPGQVINFKHTIFSGSINVESKLTVNEDRMTNPFTLELEVPVYENQINWEIRAISTTNELSNPLIVYFISNDIPIITSLEPIKAEYARDEQIKFIGEVKDDTYRGFLYCQFDDQKVQYLDTIYIDKRVKIEKFTTQVAAFGSDGEHIVRFFFKDNHGAMSNSFIFNYTINNHHPPQLKSITIHKIDYVHAYQKMNITAKVYDIDPGNIVTVYARIDYGDNIKLFEYTSDSEWHQFTKILDAPKANKECILEVFAVDDTNTQSESIIRTFSAVVEPSFYLTIKHPWSILPGTPLNVTGIIGDYPPGSEIAVSYYYYSYSSPWKINIATDYFTIGEDWKSEEITFHPEMPTENGYYYLAIVTVDRYLNIGNKLWYNFVINVPPTLISWEPIKDTYFRNEYINIRAHIFDDFGVTINYYFDYRKDGYEEPFWIGCKGVETVGTGQIAIPIYFGAGNHSLTIYGVDGTGAETERMTQTFIYDNRCAPVLDVRHLVKSEYRYSDEIVFNVTVIDDDVEDIIYVEASINQSAPIVIMNETSNGVKHELHYSITNPRQDCVFPVVFYAYDSQNARSKIEQLYVYVRQSPEIVFTSEFITMSRPNSTVTLSAYVADFDPGTVFQILYCFNNNYRAYATPRITMKDNYLSDEFSFDIKWPEQVDYHKLQIWAETTERAQSKIFERFIAANAAPKITDWREFKTDYAIDEFMNIDLNVTDDSSIALCYAIDQDNYFTCDNTYKKIKQVNLPVTFQLQLNMKNKEFGEHILKIYVEDYYGAVSSIMEKKFNYLKSHAPNISLNPHTFSGKYAYSDSLTFSGKSFEIDEGDRFSIYARVDSQQMVELGNYVANGQYHPFQYTIKIPPADGIHTLFVAAFDQHGTKSKTEELEFAVRMQPSIRLNKPLKKAYKRDEIVLIDMKVIDFKPGSTVKLFYAIDDGNKSFIRDVSIGESFTSDNLTIEIPPVGDRVGHYLKMWVEGEEGNVLSSYFENYLNYNDDPRIELNNQILDKYYKPAFIDLDLNVWDDGTCYLYYRINEDGNELKVDGEIIPNHHRTLNRICQLKFDRPATETFELLIYAKDNDDCMSNIIRKTITFDASGSTPHLTAEFEWNPLHKAYRYGDTIPVHVKISDPTVNSKVDIMYRYDNMEPSLYQSVVINGEDVEMDCEIPTINRDGVFNLYIQLVRQDGVKSGTEFKEVGIRRYPSFLFAEEAKNGYIFNEDVFFNVQLRDFDPNRLVYFSISHLLAERNTSETAIMNENYKSDNFTIMLPKLPIGRHLVLIRAGYSDQTVVAIYHELFIKVRPNLILHNKPRTTYYLNDHMDLYYSLTDSTSRTKIYYQLSPTLIFRLTEINTFGKNVSDHIQIVVDQTILAEGKYQFKFWAEDEFGYISNVTEFEFNVTQSDSAPELRTSSITQDLDQYLSDILFWYEKVQVVGQFRDKNVGDTVKLIWRIDYHTIGEAASFTANGEWQDFNVSFHIPNINKIVHFAVELVDSLNATSRYIHKLVKIQQTPSIIIKTMQSKYKPGDEVTVRGYAVDLDPGTEVDIFYKFNTQYARRLYDANHVGKLTISDEYSTPEFSFNITIPEASRYNGLQIWAENSGRKVAEFADSYGIINFSPELRVTTEIKQDYYNKGAFNFDAKIKDNTKAKIICIIDGLPNIEMTDWIVCNNEEITVHDLEIELNSSYIDFGPHRIMIFAQDEAGMTSAVESFDFELKDISAPILEILNTEVNKTYSTIDVVTIQCRYLDDNINDTVKLYYNINHIGDVLIYKGIATGDWVYFNYTFAVPKSDGVYITTYHAVNENKNSRSTRHEEKYTVKTNPTTWIDPWMPVSRYLDPEYSGEYVYKSTKPFKNMLPDDIPYPPQGYFHFSYYDTNFSIDIRTIHNSLTMQDLIDKYLPQGRLNGTLNIYISDSNNYTLKTIRQPIITNDPPTFEMIHPINDRLYGNAYINLDIKLTDDGSAKMMYKIDDDTEKNLTDFYSLFGSSKSVRKQIEIKFGEISYSKHILTLFAVDELGLRSEEKSYPFYYYNSFSPTLDIDHLTKTDYEKADSVTVTGYIDDEDADNNITVYMRTDNEFKPIHVCLTNQRPSCHNFTYTINKHKNYGINSVIFQARDDIGASSKDSIVEYNILGQPKEKTPYRTPVPHPYPSSLPRDFTGRTSYVVYKTYSMTYATDEDGNNYTTFVEIETSQAIEITETKEKTELGFFDTVFGKYVLWPLLVLIIGFSVAVIILFIYLKKKQLDEEEESIAEMEVETIQNVTVDDTSITHDNPLYTTTQQADDPFKQDFAENDQMVPEDTTIVDEDEEITTSSTEDL